MSSNKGGLTNVRKMAQKFKYRNIFFHNRWRQASYARNCDWTIIGVSKRWSSPITYCYKFSLIGIELSIWFTQNRS